MSKLLVVDCSTGEETWIDTPDPSLDVVKDSFFTSIKQKRDEVLAGGWTNDFGTAGIHTLDLRDSDDKVNWTLLLIKTQAMITAGAGSIQVEIRTSSNESIFIPASDANTAMQSFLAWGQGVLKRKWDLDNQVTAAQSVDDLNLINIEEGW